LQTFSLPDLPYDYGALEPAISGEIMQLHHQKHHQTYITNYNKAVEQLHPAMEKGDSSAVVKLQSAIKFNGGGSTFFLFNKLDFCLVKFDAFIR
jgi:Fe-Mn family superoxide dismutase